MARKSALDKGPGRGVKVPDELIASFRAEYLRYGTLSGAARAVGLPISTAKKYADEAEEEPSFVEARKKLLTRGLDRVEAVMIRGVELAGDRLEAGPDMGQQDAGPQYIRSIAEVHRSLVQRAKTEHDMKPENVQTGPVEVVIRRAGTGDGS